MLTEPPTSHTPGVRPRVKQHGRGGEPQNGYSGTPESCPCGDMSTSVMSPSGLPPAAAASIGQASASPRPCRGATLTLPAWTVPPTAALQQACPWVPTAGPPQLQLRTKVPGRHGNPSGWRPVRGAHLLLHMDNLVPKCCGSTSRGVTSAVSCVLPTPCRGSRVRSLQPPRPQDAHSFPASTA